MITAAAFCGHGNVDSLSTFSSTSNGETLVLCAALPLIVICFARQNLSVDIPFHLAQISANHEFVNFYQERPILKEKYLRKVHIFVTLLEKRQNLL